MHAAGMLQPGRGSNLTDSGSHFYDVYECADGRWISVGPIEPRFYGLLLQELGLDPASVGAQNDPAAWQNAKSMFAAKFRERPRDHWAERFATSDACVSPVLDWDEAQRNAHLAARRTFIQVDGVVQPAPAPRFSVTPAGAPTPPAPVTAANTRAALASWLLPREIADWQARGLIE
jgi:crotonobetainyl-CoA:carnitine CoA-transferase CaiB-like acyl-CoA transferase